MSADSGQQPGYVQGEPRARREKPWPPVSPVPLNQGLPGRGWEQGRGQVESVFGPEQPPLTHHCPPSLQLTYRTCGKEEEGEGGSRHLRLQVTSTVPSVQVGVRGSQRLSPETDPTRRARGEGLGSPRQVRVTHVPHLPPHTPTPGLQGHLP